MTDEHGSDQQPVHEDVADQDHQAQSGDAGVWSDDHPPVDDFSDAGNAGEEAATVSQEAAEGDETAMAAAPPARSMLPLFAGIGGLLLIGAVIYWQFGHSAPPPPMMPTQTSSPKSSSSLGANSNTQAPIPATTKKMEESDITSLYKSPNESGSPAPAETTPTTAMAPAPEATPPAPAMPAVQPAAPAPAPITAATPAADARIDGLAVRMDTLQKAVESTAVQLTQLNNMVAANQAMPPVNNQANPALEDRLNKIEQSLMQIEHKEAAKAPTATMPEETEATPEAVSPKSVTHHKHVPAKHKHKTSSKPTTHHTMVMAPMPTLPERASSEWVLRAATPTEAWVATDARTAELKHVQIGDTLSGVGQIRSIRQTASGWEIDGSSGTIR